ncbi:nickel-dependent hydrogenase large subunit [Rhodopseudomonas sp. HC1]|uniref:nickel-dependent hydrogenase large subunit n=1 Tax=Rhodopseudomonas infernalis TaxID=2897386 RepID=UPI001EE85E99|nr:nickel-dependent hydrogenase large subunit [Rhodopseudomonas infernalis]MCG6207426.1 nickel-dependent hydrogenase large subunit [Rhodopseudomonas infernalis]
MNAVSRDDRIYVHAVLAQGRVARVEITSRRPVGVGRLAQGKPGEAIVALVPRLFALCAAAQGAAATLALSAARGEALSPDVVAAQASAVLAERLIELLRGTITSLAGDHLPAFAPHLRNLIAAARRFDERGLLDPDAIDALADSLDALGLPEHGLDDADSYSAWLASDSPLAALHSARTPSPRVRGEGRGEGASPQGRALADAPDFGALTIDPLTADDDLAAGQQLLRCSASFAARPDLAGRVPETGSLARLSDHPLIRSVGTGLAGRLLARLIEARATPQLLRALRRGDADHAAILRATSLGDGIGLGAVECARGRLYHLIALDRAGLISRYEILAPTEWNFHPQGPLARALVGAPLCATEFDRHRVAAMVAAFDPCVGFDVALCEAAHA